MRTGGGGQDSYRGVVGHRGADGGGLGVWRGEGGWKRGGGGVRFKVKAGWETRDGRWGTL